MRKVGSPFAADRRYWPGTERVRRLALGGMLAGMVFALTYFPGVGFALRFNLGDVAITCAALLVGARIGVPAAIAGSVLADLLAGGFQYVPFTIVAKGALALLSSGAR